MGSADDVAQDVCMAVVTALPNYQLKGLSFRAFVYGIAAHKVTDAFRAIGRNRAEPVADLPDAPGHRRTAPSTACSPPRCRARLGKLLRHLTPRQREVLVLRLAVGLSAEETAQAVRSTPGAVRVTQHRALGRLRKILLGESGARGLAAAERIRADPAAVADRRRSRDRRPASTPPCRRSSTSIRTSPPPTTPRSTRWPAFFATSRSRPRRSRHRAGRPRTSAR